MTDEDRDPHAGGGDRDVGIEDLAGLGRHLPFFLGRAVIHEDVAMRDDIECDLLCEVLGFQGVIDVNRAGLVEQFVHRGAARPGNRLIGRDDDPLDPGEVMERLQCHDHLDRRAVRVGDDAAFRVLRNGLRIDLRHHQRHVRLHPEPRGVVDHHGARLCRTRRKRLRYLGPRRRKNDIDAAKIVGIEALNLEDVILAKRNLAADRARRRQSHHVVGGKLALGERRQDFASDIAGRADDRYPETHLETPRANNRNYGC